MALILTRRPGESVKIGDNVVMTVREVHPKKIYVVFEASNIQNGCWIPLYASYLLSDVGLNLEVTGISGSQVRLAFEADKSVKIVRTELLK
jgi:sRNA-binding carbon storage regulator CsrA